MGGKISEIHKKLGVANLENIELLQAFAAILFELKSRNVIRTKNNPVADYSEWLVANRLNLTLEGNSSSGYDAVDNIGTRIQIKSRRISQENKSVRSSAIRNLPEKPFDVLIGIVFKEDFSVDYVLKVPIQIVSNLAKYNEHTNSYIFYLRKSLFEYKEVENLTNLFC